MAKEFVFEKLKVWNNARRLVIDIYELITDFPKEEKYGLSDQLRRAVISVASNIAEGAGRYSIKEKFHFFEIAYGSLMEVICQLMIATDLKLISEIQKETVISKAEVVAMQLSSFRKNLIEQLNSQLQTPNSKLQTLNPKP